MAKISKPLILMILDGFGHTAEITGSAWQTAKHPNFEEIESNYPFTVIQASGMAVGLPWGEAGNSEVGHLTIGAGKIIYSHLPRIITATRDGSFFQNKAFIGASEHIKKTGGNLHLMGLFSSGSVHAYAEHLYSLLEFAKNSGIEKIYLHLFTDGRDASETEGATFVKQLDDELKNSHTGAKIASIIGRFYSMDREGRWPDIEKSYRLLTEGQGEKFSDPSVYISENYKKEITDEFIPPAFAADASADAKALADKPASELALKSRIKDGDAVIFYNYREDSAKELTQAFTDENFSEFPRKKINDLFFVTMTQYDRKLSAVVAFAPLEIEYPLARIISEAGLKQIHIGETEKYAHITYFVNGGKEEPFANEDRLLVPSPRTAHYDEVPEMSAYQITEKIMEILDEDYDFILVNFANADMIGHTGNLEACSKAVEVLDECVGKIAAKVLQKNGAAIITSDHGNVEEKIYYVTGKKRTNHTLNPVPFYLVGNSFKRQKPLEKKETEKIYGKTEGTLTDVAPTILEILNLKQPPEMTGRSLLSKLK